ncbi:MAG: LLM class flavin-dependent oxidoreductase [Alphaproteobacteria bacterium]|nr:LLM class flavin-dependent oxidoreductase [Alphaproteobacteria bacterium]
MQVGVMVTSYNHRDWDRMLAGEYSQPAATSDIAIHEETMKLGAMVEPLGFDAIWCAEHYGSPYSMQGNPLQWLAYWAGRTQRVDMGTAVIVAPWWQPVKLAHEIAMLDLLLGGRRLHIGIGRGISSHEYAGFNVAREESRERFSEMIQILKRSDTDRFEFKGKHYTVPPTTVRPSARHRGSLFSDVRGAFNTPSSMQVAAELGLGQMFVTATSLEVMAKGVARFNAIRRKNGLPPNQPTVMMYLHCSTDKAEIARARTYAAEQGWAARNHYAVWNAEAFENVPDYEDYAKAFRQGRELQENESILSEDSHLIGTPDEILEKIARVQERISLEYLILHPQHGSKPAAEARASLELFAKAVLPQVQAMATPLHAHSLGTAETAPSEGVMGGAVG